MCRNIVLPDKTTLETVGEARQHFKHFPDSLFSYNPGVTPSDDSCLCNLNVTELAKLNGFTATPDAFDWILKPMTNQELANAAIGKTVNELEAIAKQHGVEIRVTRENSKNYIGTCDVRPNRMNVTVTNGTVSKVNGFG